MPKKAKPKPVPKAKLSMKVAGYEYDYIELSGTVEKDAIISELNKMGGNGWRFIEVEHLGGLYRVWFVRDVAP